MFSPAAFAWFAGIEADNSKAYFAARRPVFEAEVREPFGALLEVLADGRETKVFRQHRDVRFSHDKSPYKTRTYGTVAGRFYVELSARGLYAGTGAYGLAADRLERYRAAVAADASGPALVAAVDAAEAAGLDVEGWGVKTAPRGYPRDHPRIALLRHKALVAGSRLAPGPAGIPTADAVAHCRDTWRAAEPINAWLDAHVGPETPGF